MVLLHLIKEVLHVLLEHLLRTVRTHGDVGRPHVLGLRCHADHQLGAETVEVATEVVVLAVVRLSPFVELCSLQSLPQTVKRSFNGYAHHANAPWVCGGLAAGSGRQHQQYQ